MLIMATTTNLVLAALLVVCGHQKQPVADAWWFSSTGGASNPAVPVGARALATFDMDGVKGTFKFTQRSPSEPTTCEYDLSGLKGNNNFYHVHVRPVPPQHNHQGASPAQLCGDPATGGHLNPHNITAKLPPKSAPLDKYEIGDLSGKHGPLNKVAGIEDRYAGGFTDDRLPMFGENSIIDRSIVIHKNDGKRWVCASIAALK